MNATSDRSVAGAVPATSVGDVAAHRSRSERRAAERSRSRAGWWVLGWGSLVVALIVRFWLVEFYLPPRVPGDLLAYVVRPGSWLAVALLGVVLLLVHRSSRVKVDWLVVNFALGWACVQGLVWLGAGMVIGFGTSPYDFSGFGIARNAFYFLAALLGGEIARAYLVGAPGRKRLEVALVVPAVAIALGSVSIHVFDKGPNLAGFASVLPTLAEGLATSLFVYMGGLPAGLIYRGVLEVLRWMLPLLPDLPASVQTFIGTMLPVVGMLLVARLYPARLPETEAAAAKHASAHADTSMRWWVTFAVVSVTVVWLAAGILGVRPVLVASRSMEPRLKLGDIVLARPIVVQEARPGNVVLFRSEEGMTVHRVVKVSRRGDAVLLTTKGDANNEPDEQPVTSGSVVGRVVLVLPKVGWLSIGVKNGFAWLRGII